jgi:hypothetical protein
VTPGPLRRFLAWLSGNPISAQPAPPLFCEYCGQQRHVLEVTLETFDGHTGKPKSFRTVGCINNQCRNEYIKNPARQQSPRVIKAVSKGPLTPPKESR